MQERDVWADGVYLDLKKAFDKVLHGRLIWKIKKKGGVDDGLIKWFKNFLTNREKKTIIRDRVSC